jgi:hypothetical protein
MSAKKCVECGFLSVWIIKDARFVEATERFRKSFQP